MSPRPLWRWWLWCAALRLHFSAPYGSWRKAVALWFVGWCVLPTWLASEDELAAMARGEVGDGAF